MRNLVLALALVVSGCECVSVYPGHIGVQYSLTGGDKGDLTARGVGRYFLGYGEEMEVFPTYTQNYTFDRDDGVESPGDQSFTFQTNEGQSVNTDISVQYQFVEGDVVKVFQTYRRSPRAITHEIIRNVIRDALNEVASKMKVEDVYGERKNELRDEVERLTKARLGPTGITVVSVNFINAMRLPESVSAAMTAKIAATQVAMKIENELRQTEAEAKKKVAEAEGAAKVTKAEADGEAASILARARAQADANALLAKSLTPELVRYRQLEISRITAEKWDGKLPVSFGGGDKSAMMLHMTPADVLNAAGGR